MPNHAKQLLHEYLTQKRAHGASHVWLSAEARETLVQKQQGAMRTPPVAARPSSSAPTAPARPHPPAPAAQASPPLATPVVVDALAASADKKEELARLAIQAENSERVKSLGTMRDIMVFATGSPDADIMFIGEAPGAEEEKMREPFVGPAGQTLTKIIQAMGLRRSEVYITNICKHRPIVDDGRPQNSRNRAPTAGEMNACLTFVTAEINIVQPKVIVALGSTAATGLGIEGTVGKLRGHFSEFRNVPVMVTYHPSYLLRREQEDGGGIAEKRLVWEDMMMVMERVGLAVTEKQRGYFLKARS